MSAAASAFISGRYCPECGYALTGLPHAERVTCPECGGWYLEENLSLAPPAGVVGRICQALVRPVSPFRLALFSAVISCGLASVLLLQPSLSRPRCVGGLRPEAALRQLHGSIVLYAANGDGQYPSHAGTLLSLDYILPHLISDRVSDGPEGWLIGEFDLLAYDWNAAPPDALRAAIESADLTAPYHPFGDYWLVRLAQPTGCSAIIAGWSALQSTRTRWVVFDDGHTEKISEEQWPGMWKEDDVARKRRSLPLIDPPPPWTSTAPTP